MITYRQKLPLSSVQVLAYHRPQKKKKKKKKQTVRFLTAFLLTEVCYNVATEPPLQPLTGESYSARSVNMDDNAHLDIRARDFWNNHQDAFFDVRVFYPNAPSNRSTDAYRKHELAKKREYGQRVHEIERGVFTPLVLSTNGGMGKEANTFYRRLGDMITQKRQHPYPKIMGWLRCQLSFASIRASIMCIREVAHHYTDQYIWTIFPLHLRRGMYPL